jgi:hypothetical protein
LNNSSRCWLGVKRFIRKVHDRLADLVDEPSLWRAASDSGRDEVLGDSRH